MKTTRYILLFATLGCAMTACVEDETVYDRTPVNEVSVEGLEERYSRMAYSDYVTIEPTITGSIKGDDCSSYEYTWYICRNNHTHDTISHEKKLNWLAEIAPGTHTLYLAVKDKESGLEKIYNTTLELSSPFTRGFLIFGNRPKTDNLVGLDMLSMINGRQDTIYIKDVFDNSEAQLKDAEELIYTGNLSKNRFFLKTKTATYNPQFQSEFTSLGKEFNELELIECLVPHEKPMTLVDVGMTQGLVSSPLSSQKRAYITKDLAFGHYNTEGMQTPVNRYSASSNEYFKFYPRIFYNTRKRTNYPMKGSLFSPIILYDTDHDCFSYYLGSGLAFTYMAQIQNTVALNQQKIYMSNAPSGRKLIYGENDYHPSGGRCNFILKDDYNAYYLYRLVFGFSSWSATPAVTSPYFCQLDIASMTDFLNREHIFFSSAATSLIYYSVGNTLYAYDYVAKRLASKQFDGNITYLAPEVCSISGDVSNYWVATFDGEKGHLYKMKTIESANNIEFTHLENQDWEIDLEIKSVLWKKGPFY